MTVEQILLRGDLAAAWTAANPVLGLREPGIEIDSHRQKIGDGVTPWVSLPYSTALPADVTGAQTAAATDATTKANAAQAYAVQRANHTGTQPASTVTGLAAVATTGAYTDLSGKPALGTAAAQPTTAFDAAGAASSAQAFAIQRANHTGTQPASTVTGLDSAISGIVTPGGSQTAAAIANDAALKAAYAATANPAFTGTVGLPGGTSGNPRQPVNGAVAINGNTARNGTGDKVGYSFAAVISGGFTGDTGSNPTFAWGADDFVRTGSTAGDIAGLTTLKARETELHLYTPSATLNTMTALQLDCKIEASATGATVTSMFGLYVTPIAKDPAATGTTVTNAYGIYIEAPTAGTNNKALYANGAVGIVGPFDVNGATTLTTVAATGQAQFTGAIPQAQGATAGAYIGGTGGGNHGISLADGTNTVQLDINAGTFRVLKAGVQANLTLDLSGNLFFNGGLSFNPATTATAPAAGGAGALPATPAGYMTVTVGGTARKVAYY